MADKLTVQGDRVKLKKGLLGGLTLSYRCPKCREALETKESDALEGDACPTCSSGLVFDEQILVALRKRKQALEDEQNQKKEQAIKKAAEKQAAKQKEKAEQEANLRLQAEQADKQVREKQNKIEEEKRRAGPKNPAVESLCGSTQGMGIFIAVLSLVFPVNAPGSSVVNMHRMQFQFMMFLGGLCLLVMGGLWLIASRLGITINLLREIDEKQESSRDRQNHD